MRTDQFLSEQKREMAALFLRVGLGLVFLIGGISKLSLLLSTESSIGIVSNYMGSTGYINELFQDYLFSNGFISPWGFLTALSTFELFSGLAFLSGFLIRPLSIIYAFLLWSFVVALPVETVPNVDILVKTYTSPAIMVQIRDISLSGMMFVLFMLGSGAKSLDNRLFAQAKHPINWNQQGLLLRLSIAVSLLVAGFFGHYAKVPNFATMQIILAVIGLVVVFSEGLTLKVAGASIVAVMLWYIAHKLNADKNIIGNLNGFKREFAFSAAAIILIYLGGGESFTLKDLFRRSKSYLLNQTQPA